MANLKNVAGLLRDDVTTLKAKFDDFGREYTFKVERVLAEDLGEGSAVLVRANDEIKTVTVVSVDLHADIDIDAKFQYKWAFQKVDCENLERLEKEDQLLVHRLEGKRRQQARNEALRALGIEDTRELLLGVSQGAGE